MAIFRITYLHMKPYSLASNASIMENYPSKVEDPLVLHYLPHKHCHLVDTPREQRKKVYRISLTMNNRHYIKYKYSSELGRHTLDGGGTVPVAAKSLAKHSFVHSVFLVTSYISSLCRLSWAAISLAKLVRSCFVFSAINCATSSFV